MSGSSIGSFIIGVSSIDGTGPPYPRPNPAPGSNAIGSFIIGVSPIGMIPPFDFWNTVLSQYANSGILTTLIHNFNRYIDQTANLENFFDLIWNIDTAVGYGLDVWGRIIGVSRTLTVQVEPYAGFEEQGPTVSSFGQGPFFAGTLASNNFQLSDSAYRQLLFVKALANISDGSIPSINQILLNLFRGRGNAYVTDGLDMSMTYTFVFSLSPVELAILTQSGALPKPVGVSATIIHG